MFPAVAKERLSDRKAIFLHSLFSSPLTHLHTQKQQGPDSALTTIAHQSIFCTHFLLHSRLLGFSGAYPNLSEDEDKVTP